MVTARAPGLLEDVTCLGGGGVTFPPSNLFCTVEH